MMATIRIMTIPVLTVIGAEAVMLWFLQPTGWELIPLFGVCWGLCGWSGVIAAKETE